MIHKTLGVVLVAGLVLTVGIRSAEAIGPGKYQRGLGKAVVGGAVTGHEVAGVGGAVVGAVAGGAYYDHQHNSNKVHNYRTPRVSWSRFEYGNGAFVRQGQVWIEYQNGRPSFRFAEVSRTQHFIDLFDASRQITVRIENGRSLILLPGRNWEFLYHGQSR